MPGLTSRKTIRASDIGTYLYCRRAWWYRLQGYASENQPALEQGSQFHHGHSRQVIGALWLRRAGFLLFLAGLGFLAVAALMQILQ
jgi:hypothetical protein